MSVALEAVSKKYEAHRRRRGTATVIALHDVDLDVPDGELLVVVGPSGSGKTTLLRCIAGLERVDDGRVRVAGRDVTNVPPGDRDVAMVFQDYALYPHLTVADNISFGLRARKVPPPEIEGRVEQAAVHLGLDDVLDRPPAELSGGERQRVALARAIVREPAAFLMDEPLSNLDAELRVRTRTEIRALVKQLGRTTVFVTHDQVEAMTIGDRVAVLRDGRVEQIDDPAMLYDHPTTAFVARFLGSPPMNLFPGDLYPGRRRPAVLGLRPERIRFVRPAHAKLVGRVVAVENIGGEAIVHVDVGEHRFLARVTRPDAPARSEEIGVHFDDSDLHSFDAMDGKAIPDA